MQDRKWLRPRRLAVVVAVAVAVAVSAAVAYGGSIHSVKLTFTPKSADQITNIDVLRQQIKNYYGASSAVTGSGATGTWKDPLNLKSNYAREAEKVAKQGEHWLSGHKHKKGPKAAELRAIVLDVDDTTLATWNYELFSNWDFNPGTNGTFVTNEWFPAVPGMVDMVTKAKNMGYAVFFLTGRPSSQYGPTLYNLTNMGDFDGVATSPPSVDAGYPTPTTIDRNGAGDVGAGLFTKPGVGSYPAYLNKPEFCADAIAAGASCPTIRYKSGVRAYIESKGYEIAANFGDQFSDLLGGHADKAFKLPNPNYFLP